MCWSISLLMMSSDNPVHISTALSILGFPGIFNFFASRQTAILHSHTLLLYLKTAVYNLAEVTSEFMMINLQPLGKTTSAQSIGLNWIYRQVFSFPRTDID